MGLTFILKQTTTLRMEGVDSNLADFLRWVLLAVGLLSQMAPISNLVGEDGNERSSLPWVSRADTNLRTNVLLVPTT